MQTKAGTHAATLSRINHEMGGVVEIVDLTSTLIREDTAGAEEWRALRHLAPLLQAAGFDLSTSDFAPGRPNLIACFRGGGDLTFSGHLDTVSINPDGWVSDPLEPYVHHGRLVGRGSSDMKGGLAAMALAAIGHVTRTPHARGFTLCLTSGEEEGCLGAKTLPAPGLALRPVLIVAESTSNAVRFGHRGATWFEVVTHGLAAHGSRPELGRNAIIELLRAVSELDSISPSHRHAELGMGTTNVGTIAGGTQTNMVPAEARMTVDLRTVPGTDVDSFQSRMMRVLEAGECRRLIDLPPVWTDPDSSTADAIVEAVASVTNELEAPRGTTYFTDAAVLAGHDPRAFIVGPGDPEQPHTANESCSIQRLEQSIAIYETILDYWERSLIL